MVGSVVSIWLTFLEGRSMIDRVTLPLAMPGFQVLNVTMEPDGGRLVLMESVATDGGCPPCRMPYESGR